jgi:hypothetical protein
MGFSGWVVNENNYTTGIFTTYGDISSHEKRIAALHGRACYGCCEHYNSRWKYVMQLPNLRRVSVSPFSDQSKVPELLGKDYVASVKLHPSILINHEFNEPLVRKACRKAVEDTKGGICEFIMKDNHTLGKNPDGIRRWVEIMREEIDRGYSKA